MRAVRRVPATRKKKACSQPFALALEAELDRFVAPGTADSLDLEAVEVHVRRRALAIAGGLLARRLNADRTDHQAASRPCPRCGKGARYAGRRSKTFLTALGPMELERAYYHCARCGTGHFPRDEALGLAGTLVSPAVARMSATAASMVSFAEASSLLDELAGLQVGPKQVERTAERVGREVAEHELGDMRAEPAPAPVVYLGMDGTGIPVRKSETAGRKGKQADGTARTREVKLVLVWTAQARNKQGNPQRDPGSVRYSAAVESAASCNFDPEPSAFSKRVRREADRSGFAAAPCRVVLGDGAAWIWNLAAEQFPGAIEIVDLFHAKQRLWECAKAIFGSGDRARLEDWAEQRCEELTTGNFRAMLKAVRAHADECENAAACVGYFEDHRERMRYPEFRAAGLCVGSGVVEAGCKTAIGARLKRAGMHWTLGGANAILALRCSILSGRFEDFWAQRGAAAGGTATGAQAPPAGRGQDTTHGTG